MGSRAWRREELSEKQEEPSGLLNGFGYKTKRGLLIKMQGFVHCRKEFSFHRSNASFKYHRNAEHLLVEAGRSTAPAG